MRNINKITGFAVGGVLLAGMASNAHAATTSIQFGPVSTGSLLTDLNSNFVLSKFNPSLGTLDSVTLELDASYDTKVTITNTGTSSANIKAFTEIQAILSPYGVTNNGGLDTSPVGGQFQSFLDDTSTTFSVHALAAGSTSASGLFTFSDTTTNTASDAPTLALFTGSGNINLNYETLTVTTQTVVGTGNANSAQTSHANLTGTVVYYYTPTVAPPSGTPEPGVTAFMAAGLLSSANLLLRRRRRQRA